MYNDIFISYRNDPEGRAIGRRIKSILEEKNYSVYFNPDEQKGDAFPEELREAVINCKDFVLVMASGCLERLLANEPVDWLREEIIMAHENNKHIVPILIEGVRLPSAENAWPESIRFLFYVNYIIFPADPDRLSFSPMDIFERRLHSLPEKGDNYRDVYNSNPAYDVLADYRTLVQKVETGDLDALYELALNYYYGFVDAGGGSRRDYEKAYECFKKLSETENQYKVFAINMIGHMYYSGTIPREGQSYEESLKRHLQAAGTIDSAAQHAAYMMSIGSGCGFDYDRIAQYYETIVQRGDSSIKLNFASFLCDYGKYTRAAELLRQLYPFYPAAAITLGNLYKLGVLSSPPKPDYFMAAYFYQHAIQSGQCGAEPYYELAKLYFNPTGNFQKNFKLAQENFAVAADLGHADAQYILGYMYENGHVERNIEKAIHYHELAAKQGHMAATANLAILYQQPEHINYHRAFKYAKTAAMYGMSMGEFYYANLLFIGRGCEADMNEAYKYYKKSYEHGFIQAKTMMDKVDAILKEVIE